MGKASSAKKVARAASTGGGRTKRGDRPWGWYSAMALVSILGTLLIVTSREDHQRLAAVGRRDQPRVGIDHWHAAFGIYLCDKYAPPVPEPNPLPGLHTHGDEVIHIEPGRPGEAGKNATLGTWAKANGVTLTPTRLKASSGKAYANGDKCGAKAGRVTVRVGERVIKGDPRSVRLRDGQQITMAFVPAGTKIPPLPASALAELQKNRAQPSQPSVSIPVSIPPPGETPPGETPPGGTPASAPPDSTAPPGSTAPPPSSAPPSPPTTS